VPSDSMP